MKIMVSYDDETQAIYDDLADAQKGIIENFSLGYAVIDIEELDANEEYTGKHYRALWNVTLEEVVV